MRVPAIQGVIRRRILANYRVDPAVMQRQLPDPFRPKLHEGWAIAGICLIRLERVRPEFLPIGPGLASENAAHRVAVAWDAEDGPAREGVYIPRRDTNSRLNALVGGRLFPGVHHHARFDVTDRNGRIALAMCADDGSAAVRLVAREADALPPSSGFGSLEEASSYFRAGSHGYSATADPARLDGLELRIDDWVARPLAVESIASSYFDDPARFPPGSVVFDHALLMRDVPHRWISLADLPSSPAEPCCSAGVGVIEAR